MLNTIYSTQTIKFEELSKIYKFEEYEIFGKKGLKLISLISNQREGTVRNVKMCKYITKKQDFKIDLVIDKGIKSEDGDFKKFQDWNEKQIGTSFCQNGWRYEGSKVKKFKNCETCIFDEKEVELNKRLFNVGRVNDVIYLFININQECDDYGEGERRFILNNKVNIYQTKFNISKI